MKGKTIVMLLGDVEVPVVEVDKGLVVPQVLMDSEGLDDFVDCAMGILSRMPDYAKDVAWVIGSTDRDIEGTPRKSESHLNHEAFDMSPCFSDEQLVSPSRQIMGLAWNLLNLAPFRGLLGMPGVCVEGDHLHVLVTAKEAFSENALPCVPTIATWYPLASIAEKYDKDIFNHLYIYDDSGSLIKGSPQDVARFIDLF